MKIGVNLSSEVDEQKVKILLRDALHDFIRLRSPAKEYVAKRYAHMDEQFRTSKLPEVESRLQLAHDLKNQI